MSRHRAIVIGGSMSGMLAARVLADHFAEVVLFDRDAFPQPRREPQGRAAGTARARVAGVRTADLEGYFPGFKGELYGAGRAQGGIIRNCAGSTTAYITRGSMASKC